MAVEYSRGKRTSLAKVKVGAAGVVGALVTLLVGLIGSWKFALLFGWDAAALLYVIWTWRTIWPMTSRLTAQHAVREDPSRGAADAVVLAASVASLIAVGIVLASAHRATGFTETIQVALGVVSVVIAWTVVHTLFTLHYAEQYYYDEPGGVDFPKTADPAYKDFAYLAFTMGMTFQTSDTSFQTTAFRRVALRHALISYLFGTIIVATTINLIAGLSH